MANNDNYILKEISKHQDELILIVDDQPDTIKYLEILLREYQTVSVLSAMECIQKAEELQPDLILLDIMMPQIDGFEAAKMLKSNEKTAHIPIIFLTARVRIDDVIKGFEIGANDYVTKPFEPAELLARINVHLDLQKAKRKIVEQVELLKVLNEDKDKFLRVAAHDLRNPLKVINGFTKLIREQYESMSDENMKEFLNDISHAADDMLLIIDDILTINDLEEERYELVIQRLDLGSLISILKSEFDKIASEKNIRINIEEKFNDPIIENDVLKTKEILENLISNALKFSFKDSNIWLIIDKCNKEELENGFIVKVTVKDEGPGIPDDELPYIFNKFCLVSNKPTGDESCSGLGLAISKSLAEILGYNLSVKTTVGVGTEFILLLPKRYKLNE